MAEGSGLSAEIYFEKVPKITEVLEYLLPQNVPGGTNRNWASYGSKISLKDENLKLILTDPQTSGGLLVAIAPDFENNFIALGKEFGLELKSIGKITSKKEHAVIVT
jgi:selenide,water dikinase